jgi:hypothetical protein
MFLPKSTSSESYEAALPEFNIYIIISHREIQVVLDTKRAFGQAKPAYVHLFSANRCGDKTLLTQVLYSFDQGC